VERVCVEPFSQKSRTPTVAKEFQIGLYDPAEADLELFRNSWSAGFLGERLYVRKVHSHYNVHGYKRLMRNKTEVGVDHMRAG